MAKIGDTEVKGGIQTTVTNIDPETGQISWDVEYSADYQKLFKDITDLMKTAKVTSDNIVNILQYLELVEELKTAHG